MAGLLYSICHLLKTSIFNSILLQLRANRGNYEVFLYPKGNEFWFNMVELAGNISQAILHLEPLLGFC
jgi:hypothetical protein